MDTVDIVRKENVPAPPSGVPAAGSLVPLTFDDCAAAVVVEGTSGIASVAALPPKIESQCPGLAAILRLTIVTMRIQAYIRQDAQANEQRKRLKLEGTVTNLCLLGTGVVSACVLLATALQPAGTAGRYVLMLGILIIVLGSVGTLFSHIAMDQGRAGRWLARRGEAELARLDVFRETANRAAKAGSQVALYALAVVVTHLLNDQRSWMTNRAADHRKSSERTSLLGGVAVALAFVGGSGAIIASQSNDAVWAVWIVLAGTVGAALAAYAINREALRRDRVNAERYEKSVVALDCLVERVEDIAGRILAGEPQALVPFTNAVTDQLSAEYKQWLEGAAQADAVLQRLDTQLRQLVADPKEDANQ